VGLFDALSGAASQRAAKSNQYAIGAGTQLGGDALTTGYRNAQGLLGTGDGSTGTALSALGAGYGQARNDLNSQYGQTQGYLGQAGNAYGNLVNQGGNAYSAYNNAIGANGAAGSAQAAADFRAAPGYEYAQSQALEAVQRSAAARGGLAGGNATADILKTATGLADQGYQQYVSNLQNGSNFYQSGVAGQANALAGQASSSQAQGTSLAALGTGYGQNAAGIYGTAANQQVGFGQNVAGLQTNAAGQLVQNNNQLAKSQTEASSNLLGGLLGGAESVFGAAGKAGGFTNLFSNIFK